jgi:hypothetical protein
MLSPWRPLECLCGSAWQFDFVGVFLVPLVFLRKDLFEPIGLLVGDPHIHERRLVTYHELLTTGVTPHDPHFLETRRFLSALTLLYCRCLHLLIAPNELPSALLALLALSRQLGLDPVYRAGLTSQCVAHRATTLEEGEASHAAPS